ECGEARLQGRGGVDLLEPGDRNVAEIGCGVARRPAGSSCRRRATATSVGGWKLTTNDSRRRFHVAEGLVEERRPAAVAGRVEYRSVRRRRGVRGQVRGPPARG